MQPRSIHPINMQQQLENAISIALSAHKGLADKGGEPYILHLFRVMLAVDTIEERIVAVLHDVLEDTSVTSHQLHKTIISKDILEAIELLTKKKNQSYESYIVAIKRNPLAAKVKKADLLDNMDKSRLKQVTEKDKLRLKKYQEALAHLND